MLDTDKGEMNIVSITRDTVVDFKRRIPKINGAYNSVGGGDDGIQELLDEMQTLLGYRPANYACVNMAVGAYCGALVWKATLTLPRPAAILLGLLAGGALAAVFGVLIGIPALRLRGDYLAIITLGFGEIIRVCIINLPKITGGTPGLLNIPKYADFTLVYLCVIVSCALIHTMSPGAFFIRMP